MRDQITETIKVQLVEPMSFIGVTYRNMGMALLTRAEITHRQLHHQSGAHCTAFNRLESVLPRASVSLTLLQAAGLVCVF